MIFVTGGTGLVGAHVLLNLSKKAKNFKALKRHNSSLDICKRIFDYYNAESLFAQINWVVGEINDIPSLDLFDNIKIRCNRVQLEHQHGNLH